MAEENGLGVYRRIATVSWAIFGVIVLVSVALYLIYQVRAVLSPFLYALAIVYVLRPMVNFVEARGAPRLLAVIVAYILVAAALTVLVVYLVPILVSQTREFVTALPDYGNKIVILIREYQGRMQRVTIPSYLSGLVQQAANSSRNYALTILAGVPAGAVNAVTALINLILAPIIAFYLLVDLSEIRETFIEVVPRRHRQDVSELLHKIDIVVGGYLRGLTIVAVIIGVSCWLWLYAVGVPYSLSIGMLAGILSIVPYFGPAVGALVGFLVGLFHSSWQLGAWAAIGMILIQQAVQLVVSPKVMSQHVRLHPALVLLALLLGAALFGVMGMIVAIPLAGIGKAVLMHYYEPDVELKPPAASAADSASS